MKAGDMVFMDGMWCLWRTCDDENGIEDKLRNLLPGELALVIHR